MNKRKTKSIAQVFKEITDLPVSKFSQGPKNKAQKNVKGFFEFMDLIKAWKEIVGEELSKHSMPLKLQKDNLVLITDHPIYSDQINFMAMVIIERIHKKFPTLQNKFSRLQFVTNSSAFQKQLKTMKLNKNEEKEQQIFHKHSPFYQQNKAEADQAMEHIEDDELKEKFISLYLQSKFKGNL